MILRPQAVTLLLLSRTYATILCGGLHTPILPSSQVLCSHPGHGSGSDSDSKDKDDLKLRARSVRSA